jgi:hypothetical protein
MLLQHGASSQRFATMGTLVGATGVETGEGSRVAVGPGLYQRGRSAADSHALRLAKAREQKQKKREQWQAVFER